MSNFEGIVPALAEALEKRGYVELTPVQKAVLGARRSRRAGVGADRLRQDRRLRPRAWRRPCSDGAERFGPAGAPLALVDRADARTRPAGAARTGMALRADRRDASPPASAAWTCAPNGARWSAAPISSSARPAACATTSRRNSLDMSALQRRGARRGRRDARSRLSRGSRIHPRRRTRRAPHADVFGHRAALDRQAGARAISATPCASSAGGEEKQHLDIEYRALTSPSRRPRERHHQRAALLRGDERAGVLQHPRRRQPSDGALQQSQLFGRGAVGRAQPERAHPRAAGDARRPRPGLHRHRCRGARHRPARSRTRHPRRSADQSRNAAAPQRPHRPRRAQGRQRADRAQRRPQAHRAPAAECRPQGDMGEPALGRRRDQAATTSASLPIRPSTSRWPRTSAASSTRFWPSMAPNRWPPPSCASAAPAARRPKI